ncbi:MAG: hypothetical protein IJJ33_00005, partial [Victivallales bacterium]|nr:hypothetical protein [Victivallales bacterium]
MTKAEEIFSAVPKTHNCAQAVAAGAGRDDLVPALAACGGGRAPNGLCGALHAALAIAPEKHHEQIKAAFASATGAMTCREIKGATRTSCAKCVA